MRGNFFFNPIWTSLLVTYSMMGRALSFAWKAMPTSVGTRIRTACRLDATSPFRPESILQSSARMDSTKVVCRSISSRLFGTKSGIPGSSLGAIEIYNEQKSLDDIDEEALRETLRRIAEILGYETYDITLLLVEDEEMQETNLETRGVDAPTDILSFPFLEATKPGLLAEPEFDIPDYYTLGDMMVDIPYIIRRCEEDNDGSNSEEDDRGVSGAMAMVSDPERRIHMLLVHGMLHLVGYDHEDDDEYEEMVTREEDILKKLGYL